MNSLSDLSPFISYFKQGEKKEQQIGIEQEVFLFKSGRRVSYDPTLRLILEDFLRQGWRPVYESDQLIGVVAPHTAQSISLEPGGQFEMSGIPLNTLHENAKEFADYESIVGPLLASHGIQRVFLGFDPVTPRDEIDWVPKSRYAIMKTFMKASHGLDMMKRTCTIQVNLDYSSEADMVAKMRVSMALQPLISPLFANSSRKEGKDSGYSSYRNHVWQHTDPDRCGLLKFVFDSGMGYERYARYLISVPLYYYEDAENQKIPFGRPFHQLAEILDPSLLMKNWLHHISMVFPEVRLKNYLELRSADTGDIPMALALGALWVGILYDQSILEFWHQEVQTFSFEEINEVYEQGPKRGLKTCWRGRPLPEILRQILDHSSQGLKRRNHNEEMYLEPLYERLD